MRREHVLEDVIIYTPFDSYGSWQICRIVAKFQQRECRLQHHDHMAHTNTNTNMSSKTEKEQNIFEKNGTAHAATVVNIKF